MATLRGGEKFAAAVEDIAGKVESGAVLRVGFMENATYPARPRKALRAAYAKRKAKGNAAPIKGATDDSTLNVATVAFWNEFGTRTSPPRPFFRNMIKAKSMEWGPAMAGLLAKTSFDVDRSLEILGEGIAGQLRESIINMNSPANAAYTIAKKGFNKPLVDSSHMLQSVSSEVVGR